MPPVPTRPHQSRSTRSPARSTRRVLLAGVAAAGAWRILGGATNGPPSDKPDAAAGATTALPPQDAPPLTLALPLGGPQAALNQRLHDAAEAAVRHVREGGVSGLAERRVDLLPLELPLPGEEPTPAQWLPLELVLAAGAPPDLVAMTSLPAPGSVPTETAIANGRRWFIPLDSGDVATTVTALHPAAVAACFDDGALTSLPVAVDPLVLRCAASSLEAAGVDPDRAGRGDWTWDGLRRAAAVERARRGMVPTGECRPVVDPHGGAALLSLIWQNGGHVVDDKGRAGLLAPESIQAARVFAELHGPHATTRAGAAAGSPPQCPARLPVEYLPLGEALPSGAATDPTRESEVVALPTGRRAAVPLAVTATLSVTHASARRDESVRLAAWLAGALASVLPIGAAHSAGDHWLPHAVGSLEGRAPRIDAARERVLVLPTVLATFRVHAQLGLLAALLRSGSVPLLRAVQDVNEEVKRILDGTLDRPD